MTPPQKKIPSKSTALLGLTNQIGWIVTAIVTSIIPVLLRLFKVWLEIIHPIKVINFWNWTGTIRKCALARDESTNNPIAQKQGFLYGTNNLFTHCCIDIAGCIVNIGFCLHEKSSSIKAFYFYVDPERWELFRK